MDKHSKDGQRGFTLVELIIVLVITLVIMAGIVVLLSGTFDIFKSNRNLLAVTDSSRRAIASMARQLRGALQLVDGTGNSDENTLTFYANVKGPELSFADVEASGNWLLAPRVKWTFDSAKSEIIQTTTDPGAGVTPVTSKLASHVTDLEFKYYRQGTRTEIEPPQDFNLNKETGVIRIIVKVQRGNASRTFHQDVFLRVSPRTPEGETMIIASVDPTTGKQGDTITMTIVGLGTHFMYDADPLKCSYVTFYSTDVTADPIAPGNVISSTRLEGVIVNISSTATTEDLYDVGVITGTENPYPRVNAFEVK